jgi:hypothetical protein
MFSCCFRKPTVQVQPKLRKSQEIATVDTNDDIIYMRLYDQEAYELDMQRVQTWVFDKNMVCTHGKDAEHRSYVDQPMSQLPLADKLGFWEHVVDDGFNNIEIKHTLLYRNELVYVETKTLYYTTEVKEIYGCMLILIPYKPKEEYKRTSLTIPSDTSPLKESGLSFKAADYVPNQSQYTPRN